MRTRTVLWLSGLALLAGCRLYGVPTYPAAGVFAGTALGATAIRRAATGGCWATCFKGSHCDHHSGLCEPDDERPRPASFPTRRANDAGALDGDLDDGAIDGQRD